MSLNNLNEQSLPGRTIRESYGPETLQFGELHLPQREGLHPVVILIHGGFWRARYGYSLMTGLAEDLARRGIAAWNIEYRRIGDGGGGGWPATLRDPALATDYMRTLASRYSLDIKRVVTIGHSAGGHLAFWLAARPHLVSGAHMTTSAMQIVGSDNPLLLAGAISLAGVVDLELAWRMKLGAGAVAELLRGSPNEVPERYAAASPAALLPFNVPQVLIHGTEDDSVPLKVSQAYAHKAQEVDDNARLIVLQGVEHFELISAHSIAWATTIEALQPLVYSG